MNAVVLLSGGLDSSTVLAWALAEGRTCYALSFDYGQRHLIELERAREIADALGAAEHIVAKIDLRAFGGSALTADIDVPKDRIDAHGHGDDAIPVTYVPARNTIFLSHALAYAEVRGATEIWLGINAIDYSGYPRLSAGVSGGIPAAGRPRHEGGRRRPRPAIRGTTGRTLEGGHRPQGEGVGCADRADVELLRPLRKRNAVRPL